MIFRPRIPKSTKAEDIGAEIPGRPGKLKRPPTRRPLLFELSESFEVIRRASFEFAQYATHQCPQLNVRHTLREELSHIPQPGEYASPTGSKPALGQNSNRHRSRRN